MIAHTGLQECPAADSVESHEELAFLGEYDREK